jgi:hypothetical protein
MAQLTTGGSNAAERTLYVPDAVPSGTMFAKIVVASWPMSNCDGVVGATKLTTEPEHWHV